MSSYQCLRDERKVVSEANGPCRGADTMAHHPEERELGVSSKYGPSASSCPNVSRILAADGLVEGRQGSGMTESDWLISRGFGN